jgi:CheY-like chemotaxis protein
VVDDDPKAVEVIATFLPVSEYTVVRAYGGAEAITLAERLRPDVVLLDLMMPDISGFDVVEALQRNNITARIPIIIVTAQHITEQDRTTLSTGSDMVVEIMQKSAFTRSDFVARVRRAIQHTSGRV